MKVGLFFGSFNPIHIGHLVLAESILSLSELDRIWFVVSPQNPFKSTATLAHEFDRIDMVKLAIEDNPNLDVCDAELSMPKPSYTIDTLTYLSEQFPSYEFSLIMGEDNLTHLHKWKNYETILDTYQVIVYPRPNAGQTKLKHKHILKVAAPLMEISASSIRKAIKNNKSVKYTLPDKVISYIESKGIYAR